MFALPLAATQGWDVVIMSVLALGLVAVVVAMGEKLRGRAGEDDQPRKWTVRGSMPLPDAPTFHTHGPRSTGSRRSASAVPVEDRVRQLERLAEKGHISADDLARAKADVLGRRES